MPVGVVLPRDRRATRPAALIPPMACSSLVSTPVISVGMHRLLSLTLLLLVLTSCGVDVVVYAEQAAPVPTTNVEPQDVSDRTVVHVQGESCGALVNGGGVVIAPDLIVTNAHVIAGMKLVEVRFPGGELVPVEVVGFDANRDLGLLRIEQPGLEPAPLIRGETAGTGTLVAPSTSNIS